MVRAKIRYLVVALVEHPSSSTATTAADDATTSLYREIRSAMTQSFGLVSNRIDFQVRFCRHGMALLRVNRRDDGPQILRAVLTLLSKDVLSMHGSLRTARVGTIRCLRQVFRQRIKMMMMGGNDDGDVLTTSTKVGQPAAEAATAAVDHKNRLHRANNNNNMNTKEAVALLCRQMDEAVTAILELPY